MGGALGNTCRFEPRIQAIHAEVAFHRLVVVRIFHRNIPGAGCLTGHTANAFFLVNEDDAVITLNHCLCRTDRNTEWLFAMAAGGKNDFRFGNAAYFLERGAGNIAEKGAHGQLLVGLAMDLAAVAGNTSAGVEMNHIFFHSSILLLVLRMLFLT